MNSHNIELPFTQPGGVYRLSLHGIFIAELDTFVNLRLRNYRIMVLVFELNNVYLNIFIVRLTVVGDGDLTPSKLLHPIIFDGCLRLICPPLEALLQISFKTCLHRAHRNSHRAEHSQIL